ncbi:MAG: hypothetical protein JSV07_05780 [Acidimicrobiia bacterium]|jgi:hypothetical protein|nr:MAG: hypothetical protein JSV07_05780 [Acidimicrobiia bacterium]
MATIDELRAKAAEIDATLNETTEQAKNGLVIVAVAVLLALVIAFLTGRRRGRSERAIVEVYRE